MSQTVQNILAQIHLLSEEDRLTLAEHLTQLAETSTRCEENGQSRHPLHGSVIRYDRPTEPIAESDWEALR